MSTLINLASSGNTNTTAKELILDVKINEIGGINKGQAVYVNGANGTNILVGKADYSTEATSSKTLGLLITSGVNNDLRQVITNGSLKGTGSAPLDTSAAVPGDPVWLGNNGDLIFGLANKPYAPNHLVYIGVVVEAHAVVGEINVKVQNGYELDELHNVDLISTPPTDGDVLTFNAFTQLWEPKQTTVSGGNRLISGGASWSGTGMVFNVTALIYEVDGTEYNTTATSVTLANGDPTNPRFDAIVADDTGTVYVIAGIPAANPLAPAIPGNTVLVQYVLVATGATTPSVTNEFVYREGSTPDWLPITVPGAGTPLQAFYSSTTPPPFQGTQCLVDAPTYAGKYIQFTKASGTLLRSGYPFLSLRFRLPATLPARNVFIQLLNGNTAIGLQYLTSWGANLSLAGVWQLVVIPMSAFGNAGITSFNRIRVYFTGSAVTTNQFAFDDIKFQTGFGPQVNTATIDVQDSGATIASVAKVNFIDGSNTTAVVTQDVPNNRVNVQFNTSPVYNQTIQEEGVSLIQRAIINFTGAGVTASDNFGITEINIPGAIGNTTYYLNYSINQVPYKEFSSIPTSAIEQNVTTTIGAGLTNTVISFQTPSGVPGTTNIPGGRWAFYIHLTGVTGNTWEIFTEVYKRNTGGTETLLLTTDNIPISTLSGTPTMVLTDGVFPASTVLTTDRIVIKVKAKNTNSVSQTITFYTEGSTNYSIATTTLNQAVPTGAVTSVTGTSPIVSSGGTTPAISIPQANGTTNGYLVASDWISFNAKLSQAYQTIEDASTTKPQRNIIKFTGSGVTVTDDGISKTIVAINGGGAGGTIKTIQLGIGELYAATGSYGILGNYVVFNSAGSGSGVLQNHRWQFVVPIDFVSGAVFKITTYRPTVNFTGTPNSNMQVYVNGVLTNIDGTAAFYIRPAALATYQTFTFTLTTAVVPGDTITVLAQTALSNSENLYIRDMYVNYQS